MSIAAKTAESKSQRAYYYGYQIYNRTEQTWAMTHFRSNFRSTGEMQISYHGAIVDKANIKNVPTYQIPANETTVSYWTPGVDNKPVLFSCEKAAKMFKTGKVQWVALAHGKNPQWVEAVKEFASSKNLLAQS